MRLFDHIKGFFTGLAFGMEKGGELTASLQDLDSDGADSTIDKHVTSNRVSEALLRGEVTQEVEDLRYRTYKVDRESKNFEYVAPTLAVKKKGDKDSEKKVVTAKKAKDLLMSEGKDNKFITYYNPDGLDIITIQPNFPDTGDIANVLTTVCDKGAEINEDGDFSKEDSKKVLGALMKANEYTIKVEREYVPRFCIEEFCTRLAVFRIDEKKARLDFYVSMYHNPHQFSSRPFLSEVRKVYEKGLWSSILDIKRVFFTSYHAYGVHDLMEFDFSHIKYKGISEYDGSYIISFAARMDKGGEDLTKQYYSERMEKKYANKEKKDTNTIDFMGAVPKQTYVCEICGKVVEYDTDEMDCIPIIEPRYADEEREDITVATEYMDMQIMEQTTGKRICKDCYLQFVSNKDNK
ncbi:MAG: hypothetical protein LUD72_01500 [Bacteroidales bacterium]|nr:hypothetical protein [Bacteroidales bacterium]